MGLLDYMEGAKNKLAGLLGEMPISRMIHEGVQPPTVNGLRDALYAMPKPFNADDQAANEAAMAFWNPAGLLGKIVYHGSPHKFTKFDASKIGTGEGAQAYGHGVYLADAEGTARTYKNMAPTEVVIGDTRIAGKMGTDGYRDPVTKAWNEVTAAHGGQYQNPFATAKEWLGGKYGPRNKTDEDAIKVIEEWQRKGARVEEGGALYKADLPDEWIPKMLDWDKPLREQAPEVQEAFNSWVKPRMSTREIGPDLVDVNIEGGAIGAFTRDVVPDVLANPAKYVPTKGQDLWKSFGGDTFGRGVPDDVQRAKMLQQMGIPGIRYLDGGSRGKGQGSYNYVVFPGLEDQVKILERNGKGLLDY